MVQNTLSLVGMSGEVEPSGTAGGGNTTKSGYVSVMDSQKQPKSGAVVRITINVDASSGGHDHGENYARRDRGKITGCAATTVPDAYDCTTLSNGYAQFTFSAPAASGKHTFTAECTSPVCTGTASGKVDVKVGGLTTLTKSPDFVLIGGETGKAHTDNHWLTATAKTNLLKIVKEYNATYPASLLYLNDASLIWGGKFDIHGTWEKDHDHKEHRRGMVIDVRANGEVGSIPIVIFPAFEKLVKDKAAVAELHGSGTNRHFHVRLLGNQFKF